MVGRWDAKACPREGGDVKLFFHESLLHAGCGGDLVDDEEFPDLPFRVLALFARRLDDAVVHGRRLDPVGVRAARGLPVYK